MPRRAEAGCARLVLDYEDGTHDPDWWREPVASSRGGGWVYLPAAQTVRGMSIIRLCGSGTIRGNCSIGDERSSSRIAENNLSQCRSYLTCWYGVLTALFFSNPP